MTSLSETDWFPENDWLCKTCSQPFFGYWSREWARCHCRLCSGSFCQNHCSTFLPLTGLEAGADKLHRVCDDCYEITYRTTVAMHRISPTSQLFGDKDEDEPWEIESKGEGKSLPELGGSERRIEQPSPAGASAFKYWRFFPNLSETAPEGGRGREGASRRSATELKVDAHVGENDREVESRHQGATRKVGGVEGEKGERWSLMERLTARLQADVRFAGSEQLSREQIFEGLTRLEDKRRRWADAMETQRQQKIEEEERRRLEAHQQRGDLQLNLVQRMIKELNQRSSGPISPPPLPALSLSSSLSRRPSAGGSTSSSGGGKMVSVDSSSDFGDGSLESLLSSSSLDLSDLLAAGGVGTGTGAGAGLGAAGGDEQLIDTIVETLFHQQQQKRQRERASAAAAQEVFTDLTEASVLQAHLAADYAPLMPSPPRLQYRFSKGDQNNDHVHSVVVTETFSLGSPVLDVADTQGEGEGEGEREEKVEEEMQEEKQKREPEPVAEVTTAEVEVESKEEKEEPQPHSEAGAETEASEQAPATTSQSVVSVAAPMAKSLNAKANEETEAKTDAWATQPSNSEPLPESVQESTPASAPAQVAAPSPRPGRKRQIRKEAHYAPSSPLPSSSPSSATVHTTQEAAPALAPEATASSTAAARMLLSQASPSQQPEIFFGASADPDSADERERDDRDETKSSGSSGSGVDDIQWIDKLLFGRASPSSSEGRASSDSPGADALADSAAASVGNGLAALGGGVATMGSFLFYPVSNILSSPSLKVGKGGGPTEE